MSVYAILNNWGEERVNLVEQSFKQLDQVIEKWVEETDGTYFDGLIEVLHIVLSESEDKTNEDDLATEVKKLNLESLEKEQIRKIIEFATLKGLKDGVQTQHLITPDIIASYMVYLIEKLVPKTNTLRLFDLVSGSGNLLTAVVNQLTRSVQAYGSEVDPSLIELSMLSANAQKTTIEFFHQDSLQPFLLDPVDVVIADLPVGYYPDDIRAKSFKVHVSDEHTYAHHLLIEQGLKYTKEAGFLLFVIPNALFNSDQAHKLRELLNETAHVVALLQLPPTIFRSEKDAKSLFVLQKKGDNTKAPKEALIAQLPSLKDTQAMQNVVAKMNQWFEQTDYSN